MKQHLFETALHLIDRNGFEETTLRGIAREAGVSPGLLYRYFPGKNSLVLEFYDQLSAEFERESLQQPEGSWPQRFVWVLKTSLDVLRPHRTTLEVLVPMLVSRGNNGLFSSSTSASRERVQRAFLVAVAEAANTPKGKAGPALGRLLYLVHLAAILWWLLDRSPDQRTTKSLVDLLNRTLPRIAPVLRLPVARRALLTADRLYLEGLIEVP